MTKQVKPKAQSLTSMSAKTVLRGVQWEEDPTKFWFARKSSWAPTLEEEPVLLTLVMPILTISYAVEEHMQQLVFPFLWQEYIDAQKLKRRVRAADLGLYTNGELNYTQTAYEEEKNHAQQKKPDECSPVVPSEYETLENCPSPVEVIDGRVDLKHNPFVPTIPKHSFLSSLPTDCLLTPKLPGIVSSTTSSPLGNFAPCRTTFACANLQTFSGKAGTSTARALPLRSKPTTTDTEILR